MSWKPAAFDPCVSCSISAPWPRSQQPLLGLRTVNPALQSSAILILMPGWKIYTFSPCSLSLYPLSLSVSSPLLFVSRIPCDDYFKSVQRWVLCLLRQLNQNKAPGELGEKIRVCLQSSFHLGENMRHCQSQQYCWYSFWYSDITYLLHIVADIILGSYSKLTVQNTKQLVMCNCLW